MRYQKIDDAKALLALSDIAKGISRKFVANKYNISYTWLHVMITRHLEFRAYWRGDSKFHPENRKKIEAAQKPVEGNKNSKVP